MNAFLSPSDDNGQRPGRVYARLAQIEEDESKESNDQFFFAAVDADWFDLYWNQFKSKVLCIFNDAPLSIVALRRESLNFYKIADVEDMDDSGSWIELLFDRGSGRNVVQFLNLFGEPVQRRLSRVSRLLSTTVRVLDAIVDLGSFEAPESEISAALSISKPVHAVSVYDVGQGNCNAVVDHRMMPLVYYDFGGGVLFNRLTFPPLLKSFCFTATPTIVLSHWDWDHWSSASRDMRAYTTTWIAPNQRLDPVHAAMAAQIASMGRLLIWPSGLHKVATSALELRKCTGKPRNNDGLAMAVNDPNAGGAPSYLLATRHIIIYRGAATNIPQSLHRTMEGVCTARYCRRRLAEALSASLIHMVLITHMGTRLRRQRLLTPQQDGTVAGIPPRREFCDPRTLLWAGDR